MVLSPDRSSQGWLESLKLSGVQRCLCSAQPSVFFFLLLLHYLSSFFSLSPSQCLLFFSFSAHGFKTIRSRGCSIPLPLPVRLPTTATFGAPCLGVIISSQGVATCPPATAPSCFVDSIFPLRRGMSHLPPWRSNHMSNSYRSWLNPLSILSFPTGTILIVSSGASISDTIHTFCMVDLLDH